MSWGNRCDRGSDSTCGDDCQDKRLLHGIPFAGMGGTTSRVIVHPPVRRTVSRAETGCGHTPSAGVISAASYPVLVTGRPQVSSGMEKPVTEIFCHRPAIAVRERGVEPPRPEGHWHLKPARLPFRHSRIGPVRTQLEKTSTEMTAVENRGRTASPVPGFTSLGSSPTSSLVLVRPRLMRSHGVSGTPWWCAVCGSPAARCANFPSAQDGSDEDSHQHSTAVSYTHLTLPTIYSV